MISEFDTDGRYLMVNPAIARMFNSTTEELVGKSFDELLAPEVVNVFRERIEKVEKELCSPSGGRLNPRRKMVIHIL